LILHVIPGALAVLFGLLLPVVGGADMPVGGTLALEDCRISAGPGFPGIKARCADFERPLDPAEPDGETITLFVAVVSALTLKPAPDPFLPIAGGPGQASSEFYAGFANAFESIRRDRDIVLVDQRGTGQSTRLDCELDEEVVEGRVSIEESVEGARRCLGSLPADPRFFTTSVAVEDLEAVREALGYARLNVYGISYGTRVAQHYLRRFPASTRTVILDGVVPPQVALGPTIAIEAQRALDAIFARCEESAPCNERFPDVGRSFATLANALIEQPVSVALADPLTGKAQTFSFGHNELAGALRLLSYHPNTVALIPLLVHEAAAGNHAPLASQYLMVAESLSESLSIGMHNAIVCTEDAPFFAREAVDREALEATYIGPVQLDALEAMCSVWPEGVMDEGLRAPVATDKPVLLLSGDADPITPPRFAELAAVEMSNSALLVGIDQGHGQAGRTCMPEIMADFIEAASIEAIDEEHRECLATRQFAMPFFLDYTGPSP
jgi:pimeloyl-ACP methyl ester carboxylesterase